LYFKERINRKTENNTRYKKQQSNAYSYTISELIMT